MSWRPNFNRTRSNLLKFALRARSVLPRGRRAGVLVLAALIVLAIGIPGAVFRLRPQPKPIPLRPEPMVRLYVSQTGNYVTLPMEEYIQGVVAAEMEPSWPVEALGAQAILARTFTLKRMEQGGVPLRHADASSDPKEFQAYNPKAINDNVRLAVRATRGRVATYKGDFIEAWYHADAGGRTAAVPQEGINHKGTAPYVKSVSDPGFSSSPPENRSWTVSVPWEEVRDRIRAYTGRDPGPTAVARIANQGKSGRAITVQLGNVIISGADLRTALGTRAVRSTLFTDFAVRNGRLVIKGRGFGHGVGMSQWGAKALAEKGRSAEQIVRYFFRGIRIESAWK